MGDKKSYKDLECVKGLKIGLDMVLKNFGMVVDIFRFEVQKIGFFGLKIWFLGEKFDFWT